MPNRLATAGGEGCAERNVQAGMYLRRPALNELDIRECHVEYEEATVRRPEGYVYS